jgi:predicted RNase H-like HicB family nuclease
MVPMNVRQIIKLIEEDGWYQDRQSGQSPDLPTSGEAGDGYGARKAVQGLARRDRAFHPQTGGAITGGMMGDPRTYLIVIEQAADGGYGAWAPDLPGCVALADTIEETEREMREAIGLHIASLREHGDPVPEPAALAGVLVEVDAA